MRSQLLQEVVRILRGPCGVPFEIVESSRLVEDLLLDSVGMLALAVSLENHFRVRLPDASQAPPATVAELLDLLERTLEESSS